MEILKLTIKDREKTGRQAKQVRTEGDVPGVIYGYQTENRNVSSAYNDFAKIYKTGGESSLIDLEVEGGETVKALIKDVQRHPITDRFTHVDFIKVNLDEKIKTEVRLVFTGEAPAVKVLGGSLVTNKDTVEMECLPTDLVNEIVVDISGLETFEDMIRVSDIVLPKGIEILDEQDQVLVTVEAPRTEEEMEAADAADAADTGDVTEIKTEAELKKEAEAADADAEAEGEGEAKS